MNSIPALYHPTTLVLVDDDLEYLATFSLTLSDQFKCQLFTDYQDAEQYLSLHNTWPESFKTRYLQIDYQDLYRFSVNIEIAQIYQEAWNRQRFTRTAILIVDYDMPGTNGLELARRLKSKLPLKIILLTGEADQQTAIDAFNRGEIDRFLLKSVPDCSERLAQFVHELQWDFFQELSTAVLEPLISQASHPLQDAHFHSLFHRILREQEITEFYLLDESGSFLLLNTEGQPTWLLVRTLADMELFYDMAEMEEPDVPKAFLKALKHRKKIVFLAPQLTTVPPCEEWLVYDATQLADQEVYYCIVHGWENRSQINAKVFSYSEFLQGD